MHAFRVLYPTLDVDRARFLRSPFLSDTPYNEEEFVLVNAWTHASLAFKEEQEHYYAAHPLEQYEAWMARNPPCITHTRSSIIAQLVSKEVCKCRNLMIDARERLTEYGCLKNYPERSDAGVVINVVKQEVAIIEDKLKREPDVAKQNKIVKVLCGIRQDLNVMMELYDRFVALTTV